VVPVLTQMNPLYTASNFLRPVVIPSHLRLGLPSDLIRSGIPTKIRN
jgi:hypothetical protein